MQLLVIHGPNLNRLGRREPSIYGVRTLAEIDDAVRALAVSLGAGTRHFQSNHEGALIDAIHAADDDCHGIVFNPGAYTHYSYALRDALASVRPPCVEVHLSDIHAREPFRRVSVLKDVCLAQISGRGLDSYLDAVRLLVGHLQAGGD